MCISPIYSNSHSSIQTVDRNKRTTAFDSYHRASQSFTSWICVTPHSFLLISEAISLMCISPIYSNSHSSVQTVDRNKRTTAFDSRHRASQASHLESASHLTVFSQLVRLPHSCVCHPYIQTAIAQSRRSIETNGQRRSTAIKDSHTTHISNLRHTSQFSQQLVRLSHSCVYHPYIQTAIAQSRRSIETNGQRRSTAITEPHEHHISNLRHTSQFSHN